ncbi:MAG: hypothetical protein WA902_25105 [Thermosynechococcaceae cyanobacterium]
MVCAGMRIFGYAKLTPAQQLEQKGAIAFHDMQQRPDLLNSFYPS